MTVIRESRATDYARLIAEGGTRRSPSSQHHYGSMTRGRSRTCGSVKRSTRQPRTVS